MEGALARVRGNFDIFTSLDICLWFKIFLLVQVFVVDSCLWLKFLLLVFGSKYDLLLALVIIVLINLIN